MEPLSVSYWANRALNHARVICGASPGRGSATRAEAQAAEYVRGELDHLGVGEIRVQPFRGLRSLWFFLALAFGIALMGHLAFWLLRPPLGDVLAWAISAAFFGFSFFLQWRKFTYQEFPLQETLPYGESQNVIGVIPPEGETRQRAVLVGHLDSHRAVIWYATDFLVTLYLLLSPIIVFGVLAAPVLYGLALIADLAVFNWLGVVLGALHFVTWFSGVTADLGAYSPGANDNASAVGSLLSLVERLKEHPLEHTEVWVAFTGCEETGCGGMQVLLEKYGEELRHARFIELDMVGIGERLVYIQSEGVMRKRRVSDKLEAWVLKAGEAFDLQPLKGTGFGVASEMGVVWEGGYQGVCLMAMRKDSALLPEWHRMSDVPDKLMVETLGRVHELTWALLQVMDGETGY